MNDAVTVSLSRDELLYAIRHDCVAILAFYLGDELTLDVPEFHEQIWDEFLVMLDQVNQPDFLIGHLQKLFCVPREHAKSTLSKVAVILFMRYSPLAFTVYVSNTKGVALNAIKDIVAWLESPQEAMLYGSPTVEKANESEGTYILHIHIPGRDKRKRIILRALGSEQQVRGMLVDNKRPELIIIDDCEDLSTASTEATQARLDEWLLGSLLKASARRSVRIILGNMIRKTTLIARLSKEPDWNPTVFGCIVRDKDTGALKPLWEGRHTVHGLIKEYLAYRRLGRGHVWIHEMMNLTAEEVFNADFSNVVQIPKPNPDQISAGCIVLDPAFGELAFNDESALTVHVMLEDKNTLGGGIPHVVDSRHGRWNEEKVLDQFIELSYYWGITTWVIESVAAQRLLIPYFKMALKLREIPSEVFTILPITGGKDAKASRIMAFQRAVGSTAYGIAESETELLQKLMEYDPTSKEHDDLIDSAAYGTVVWAHHGEVITASGVQNVAMALSGGASESMNIHQLDVCPM